MSSSGEARRLGAVAVTSAVAGAVGMVGAAAGLGAVALLKRQAAVARAVIGKPHGEIAHDADRTYKKKQGSRVDLLIVGDSIAAGLGAETPEGTLGARLAKRLAKDTKRAVRLRTIAEVGAESPMLPDQLATLPDDYRPDIAVILIGGNDVTHRIPVSESTRHLVETIAALQARGAYVIVGTCPDLGALRAVPQPLRSLVSRWSRRLADAQAIAADAAGADVVRLAALVGPFFIAQPDEMFSIDQFHPSAAGYKRTAKALMPAVRRAIA